MREKKEQNGHFLPPLPQLPSMTIDDMFKHVTGHMEGDMFNHVADHMEETCLNT